MEKYKNFSGKSGIVVYEIGSDYIRVQFKDGSVYLYTYENPGKFDVEKMKELARQGSGLNSYINKQVKNNYQKKEK